LRRTPLALLAVAFVATGSAPAAATFPTALVYARPEASGSGVFVMERSGKVRLVAPEAGAPAWSADGRRLAYVAPGPGGLTDLYVADASGRRRARLTRTPAASEDNPEWAPDGRRLVVERDGALLVVRADGSAERQLAVGREPAWAPDGRRIAFAEDDLFVVNADGGTPRRLTTLAGPESAPAWSPNGRRIAFVAAEAGPTDLYVLDVGSRGVLRLTNDPANVASPRWTADGRSITFVGDRSGTASLWRIPAAGGEPVALGGPTPVDRVRWRPRVSPELRPDLDQRPPADLSIVTTMQGARRSFLLGFTSASDNVGEGALSIVASRPSHGVFTMQAAQRVRLAGGGVRSYRGVGFLRFVIAPPHRHWHLMDFQRYELRRASDQRVLVRDRKSGFCLADHWGAAGNVPGKPRRPRFLSNCGQGQPPALQIHEGTSVGYTDRYPAHFHGQNLDVTRVRAGTYVLVHRANASLQLRELRYDNNASSLRIRISWPRGRAHPPAVRRLATCPGTEFCGG
jgi:dipeptidyl aminopeptidase/acylaminoacyl peptidase